MEDQGVLIAAYPAAPAEKRVLNPFAFRSEVDSRFSMLAVAAVSLVINVATVAGFAFAVPSNPSNLDSPWTLPAVLGLPILSVLILLWMARRIYRRHPVRLMKQNGLRLLYTEEYEDFYHEIEQLAEEVGVCPTPDLVVGPKATSLDAQAFGFRNSYWLRLDLGYIALRKRRPDLFRMVVLHELGHIRNNDVGRSYLTQAIWISAQRLLKIGFFALAFYAIRENVREGLPRGGVRELATQLGTFLLTYLVWIGGTALVVAIIRASLLRVREIYADWRAVLFGAGQALADHLQRIASREDGPFIGFLSLHPPASVRLAALREPERMFRVSKRFAFSLGLISAFLSVGISNLVLWLPLWLLTRPGQRLLEFGSGIFGDQARPTLRVLLSSIFQPWLVASPNSPQLEAYMAAIERIPQWQVLLTHFCYVFVLTIPFLPLAWLVSDALVMQVQREAVADIASGRRKFTRYFGLMYPAFLYAIGFQVGVIVAPFEVIYSRGISPISNWTGWLMIAVWLVLVWARFFARRLLGTHAEATVPVRAQSFIQRMSLLLFWLFCGPLVLFRLVFTQVSGVPVLDTFLNNQTAQYLNPTLILLTLAFTVYFTMFFITWIASWLSRNLFLRSCPHCAQPIHMKYVVGRICQHCHQDLAPWAMVTIPDGMRLEQVADNHPETGRGTSKQ